MSEKGNSAPSAPPLEANNPGNPPSYNEAVGWQEPPPAAPLIGNPQMVMHNVPLHPRQPQHTTLIVQQVTAPVVMVGPSPAKIDCPACHASIKTTTVTKSKCTAHMMCLLLMFIGCWPCCCIPYCMSSFKEVRHTCPNCKSFLGVYNG